METLYKVTKFQMHKNLKKKKIINIYSIQDNSQQEHELRD
jgi:hypothetical protein